MTTQTARRERRGPSAARQRLCCPFAAAGSSPGPSHDVRRSSPLLKAPSSRTPETTGRGGRALGGWFRLPPGAALAPLPWRFGAVPWGRERSWSAGKRPRFPAGLSQAGTRLHGRLRWHDWHGHGRQPRTRGLDPGRARLAASLATLAPSLPCLLCPRPLSSPNQLETSPRSLSPLLPRLAAYVKTNVFSKAFQFLMKTSAFTLVLASAHRCSARRGCLVSPASALALCSPWPRRSRECCREAAVAEARGTPAPRGRFSAAGRKGAAWETWRD